MASGESDIPPYGSSNQCDDGEDSVSYTHLDVYKRQPLEGVALSGWTVSVTDNVDFTVALTDAKGNRTLVPISINPVSYTHLDVYKRQVH